MRREAEQLPRLCLVQYGEAFALGPVMTCAVMLDAQSFTALSDLSRREWPEMSAVALSRAARRVQQVVPYETVTLTARKFNTLLAKVTSRERVLNWAYKTALTSMFERYPACRVASYDVHAPGFAVLTTELPRGSGLALAFRGLDEVDPGLSAAGILARAYYEKSCAELERKVGEPLPRGAEDPGPMLARVYERGGGPMVLQTAKRDDPRVQAVIAAGKSAG